MKELFILLNIKLQRGIYYHQPSEDMWRSVLLRCCCYIKSGKDFVHCWERACYALSIRNWALEILLEGSYSALYKISLYLWSGFEMRVRKLQS